MKCCPGVNTGVNVAHVVVVYFCEFWSVINVNGMQSCCTASRDAWINTCTHTFIYIYFSLSLSLYIYIYIHTYIIPIHPYFEGILPKGPYLPCVSMAGRTLLAGYHRFARYVQPRFKHINLIYYCDSCAFVTNRYHHQDDNMILDSRYPLQSLKSHEVSKSRDW